MTPETGITKRQQAVFALSLFSTPSGHIGLDLESRVYVALQQALANAAPTIGRWQVVWGPAIYQIPAGWLAANEMYVARSVDDPTQYVIAIAGTNFSSKFDWDVEDFLVDVQLPWVYAPDSPDSKISLGIATGLSILQNIQPSGDRPGAGASLTDFLKTITGRAVRMVVTGHSLGGALAPTLALWLADTQGLAGHWDPSSHAAIETMPTAGFPAGNGAFAAHSDDRLGAAVARFNNSLDAIPRWWNEATLAQIPTLFEPDIPASDTIRDLVRKASVAAKDGDYTPIDASAPPLPGEVDRTLITKQSDADNFFAQAGYQHLSAYFPWFAYDQTWWPGVGGPDIPPDTSPTAVAPSGRLLIPIGLELVDPDAPDFAERLTTELRRHG